MILVTQSALSNEIAGILPVGPMSSDIGLATNSVEQNLIGGWIPITSPARFNLEGQKTAPTTPANHTVLQQGFTADIKCVTQSAALSATPQTVPLPLLDSTGASNYSLTKWSFNASCPNGDRLGKFWTFAFDCVLPLC